MNSTGALKGTDNKFIKHLSNEIVAENHHLKQEVIKARKMLKNYESIMVQQFQKCSQELELSNQNGFIFDSPLQELKFFTKLIEEAIKKKRQAQSKNKFLQTQYKNFESLYLKQLEKTDQVFKEFQKKSIDNEELQKTKMQLEQKSKQVEQQNRKKYNQLFKEKIRVEDRMEKLENQYRIKFFEEKKSLLEQVNQDMAKLRAEMDIQLYMKQKNMKAQIDKRDRQAKLLLNTINNIIEKKESKGGVYMKSGEEPRGNLISSKGENQRGNSFLQILSQAIKPFTDHANLLQKLSDSRKQNMQIKNEHRQLSTKFSTTTSKLEEVENELILMKEKYKQIHEKYSTSDSQIEMLKAKLAKTEQDSRNMEKYYDEKWDNQFSKVKFNLEKKLTDKQKRMEKEQEILIESLQKEKERISIEVVILKEEIEKAQNINKSLVSKISFLMIQKEIIKKDKLELSRRLQQVQTMGFQQVLSLKKQNNQRIAEMKMKLVILQQQKQLIQLQALQQRKQARKQIELIKVRYEEQIKTKVKEAQKVHKEKQNEAHKAIQSLKRQIESHRTTLVELQKEEIEKTQIIQERCHKQKDRQIKELKVSHLQEIGRLNQQILKFENKANYIKKGSEEMESQYKLKLTEKQKKNNELQMKVEDLKIEVLQRENLNKKILSDVETMKKEKQKSVEQFQSLRTEIKSLQLFVRNKQKELAQIKLQRKKWKDDVRECRNQFQTGFKDLKKIHEKKVSHLRSRVWELEQICESGCISRKDFEKIRALTQQKRVLEETIVSKEAQNLILTQVKQFYENRTKNLNSKLMTSYALKNEKQPVLVRKPKRQEMKLRLLKTHVSEDAEDFTGHQAVEVIKMNDNRNPILSHSQLLQLLKSEEKGQRTSKTKSKTQTRFNPRTNSSLI